MIKVFPNADFLMEWYEKQSEEVKIAFTQNVVDNFAKRYLKSFETHLNKLEASVVKHIDSRQALIITKMVKEEIDLEIKRLVTDVMDGLDLRKLIEEEFKKQVDKQVSLIAASELRKVAKKFEEVNG